MAPRHLVSLFDLTTQEIEQIFAIARDLKAKLSNGIREPLLPGRVLAMLFEKPSLRTRASFEAGIVHLGGSSMFLGADAGWGQRESTADFGRVLSEFADAIVCRAKEHRKVEELVEHCSCSVINGLTDWCHPCQALADLLTLEERHGTLQGLKFTYVGDANNVARSLAIACGKLGVDFHIACPAAYQFDEPFLERMRQELPDATLTACEDPAAAVTDAHAVYTDVWASMGQEAEEQERAAAFADYQVNGQLMQHAPDAVFLHCLPARRGMEVTDEVMDGPQSAVVQQAGNRMHAQKGVLAFLLGAAGSQSSA